MNELELAYQNLPYEVLAQYSSQTDNLDRLKENVLNESLEENKTELETLLQYAIEVEEIYTSELLSNMNYMLKFEDKKAYNLELKEIRSYIKYLKKIINN